jgi:hypothetical protein
LLQLNVDVFIYIIVIKEYGAVGGMKIDMVNQSTQTERTCPSSTLTDLV